MLALTYQYACSVRDLKRAIKATGLSSNEALRHCHQQAQNLFNNGSPCYGMYAIMCDDEKNKFLKGRAEVSLLYPPLTVDDALQHMGSSLRFLKIATAEQYAIPPLLIPRPHAGGCHAPFEHPAHRVALLNLCCSA